MSQTDINNAGHLVPVYNTRYRYLYTRELLKLYRHMDMQQTKTLTGKQNRTQGEVGGIGVKGSVTEERGHFSFNLLCTQIHLTAYQFTLVLCKMREDMNCVACTCTRSILQIHQINSIMRTTLSIPKQSQYVMEFHVYRNV